jgi:hypothetical protein
VVPVRNFTAITESDRFDCWRVYRYGSRSSSRLRNFRGQLIEVKTNSSFTWLQNSARAALATPPGLAGRHALVIGSVVIQAEVQQSARSITVW